MTEIQQNRWDQLVRRAANIVAPGSMVNDSLNELFPFINVESLSLELQYLATWKPAFASHAHGASAGNFGHTQLFNPVDSGVIVVMTRCDMRSGGTATMRYGLANLPITSFAPVGELRDTRTGVVDLPIGQTRFATLATTLTSPGRLFVQTDVTLTFYDPRGIFVLAPGTGVTFALSANNTASTVSFWWKERVAEAAELNF